MRKFALLALLATALAVPSIAAADTAQGNLTGASALTGYASYTIFPTVTDGGTSYVGAENDFSGNCDGDTGGVLVNGVPRAVVCAHFVAASGCCDAGRPKMRFAVQEGTSYRITRITDNTATLDTYAHVDATVGTLEQARECVNRGIQSRQCGIGPWHYFAAATGGFTVAP